MTLNFYKQNQIQYLGHEDKLSLTYLHRINVDNTNHILTWSLIIVSVLDLIIRTVYLLLNITSKSPVLLEIFQQKESTTSEQLQDAIDKIQKRNEVVWI